MFLDRVNQKQVIGGLAAGIIAVIVALFMSNDTPEVTHKIAPVAGRSESGSVTSPTGVVTAQIKKQTPIDYQNLKKDAPLNEMMEDRKKTLGIKKSLDMIVQSNESFTIGDTTVSMQKILEKAFTKSGKVYQEEINDAGPATPGKIKAYGIYVVQPGDNIWNIHFRILTDYYGAKGIHLERLADEPGTSGNSSGVGKILKFSETMVIIYNMVEEKVTQDINIIEPLSKIVVYNMDAVFSLLEEINFNNIDRLQFDGKNIWIPAKKS